jgi:hypothetical protein
MLPASHTDAHTAASTSDYLSLVAREPSLPPTLADFMTLLGPGAKDQHEARHAALSAAIHHLQAGAQEAASIQLWLLVSYAPALQAMALRYRVPGASLEETESSVVMAFLETLLATSAARLQGQWLVREIERDTQDRLRVALGLRDYQKENTIAATPDEALMADRLPDDRSDAYQSLQDLIQDMPITEAERSLLVGVFVYGFTLREIATQTGELYDTTQKRHVRLLKRLRERGLRKL